MSQLPKPGEAGYDPVLHGDGTITPKGILKGPRGIVRESPPILSAFGSEPIREPKPPHHLNWKATRVEKLHPIEAYGLPLDPIRMQGLESSRAGQSKMSLESFRRTRRMLHARFHPDEAQALASALAQQILNPLPVDALPSSAS